MNKLKELDCLLIYMPKLNNFYKLYGSNMFGMHMPMGLLAIADYLYQNGHNVQILHYGVEKINNPSFSIKEYLKKVRPKVVGLSLHWHHQSYDVIELARKIKITNPDIFIVLGGFTASCFHIEIMKEFGFIDGVIRGDGEVPLLDLVNNKKRLSDIPNLTWRENSKVIANDISYIAGDEDLDKFNFTNLALLKNKELFNQYVRNPWFWVKGLGRNINLALHSKQKVFHLSITRGCPVTCSYCGGSNISQYKINRRISLSIRSLDKVIESIKDVKKYGYDTIYITYLFIDKYPTYFSELFNRIKTEKIKINCHLDCWSLPTKEILSVFKDTFSLNNSLIIFSPETGSEQIRKLNKGFYYSNQELIETLEYISSLNIRVQLFFMLGLPFELDNIEATKNFQELLNMKFKNFLIIQVEILEIEPYSNMYIYPDKYNIIKERDSFLDFYNLHSGRSNLSYLKKGYYGKDFYGKQVSRNTYSQNRFEGRLQSIKCKNYCSFSNYLLFRFAKVNKNFLRIVSPLGRLICNCLSIYWKLSYFFTGGYKGKSVL